MNKRREPKTDGRKARRGPAVEERAKGSERRIASRERQYVGLKVPKKNDERANEWQGPSWRYYEDPSRGDEEHIHACVE